MDRMEAERYAREYARNHRAASTARAFGALLAELAELDTTRNHRDDAEQRLVVMDRAARELLLVGGDDLARIMPAAVGRLRDALDSR